MQETDATTPDATHNNLAGSWNFGFMTLMGQWDKVEIGSADQETWLIGGVIPLGQGEIHVSYVSTDVSGSFGGVNLNGNGGDQFAIGYVYNLSKRTALYGTYSQISNDGASTFAVGGLTNVAGNGFTGGGQKSTGYEFGLRHSF
jgi:predicted porin